MRTDTTPTRSVRRVAVLGAAGLVLTVTGCASRSAPELVLPPLPTVTTTSATRPVASTPSRRSTAATRAAATTTVAEAVAPITTAPARPVGRAGTPRTAAAATVPPTDPPAPTTTAATSVRLTGTVSAPVTTPPTTSSPVALQSLVLSAPTARAVPEGPFDVEVNGSGDHRLAAGPAAVCTVDAGRVVPLGEGDCRVRVSSDGFAPAETMVHLRRGDQGVTWQLGTSTTFTYNTIALDLRSTSGAPVRLSAAQGACKLAGSSALSFAVVGGAGMPVLGQCDVTAVVDGSPAWNPATITLSTATVRAPVSLSFDLPATASAPAFTAKVTLTQRDRSLDDLLAFSVESAGACSLGAGAALVNPSTRTATLRVSGSAPSTGWCAVRVVTDVGGAADLVTLTTPGCRFVWIGTGAPPATKPVCPW